MERIPLAQVPEEQKWNREALFSGWAEIEAELKALAAEVHQLGAFAGTFSEKASHVADYIELYQAFLQRVKLLEIYLRMATSVDLSDEQAKSTQVQFSGVETKFQEACAFAEPEMVAMIDALLAWATTEPELALYRHYFETLKQKAGHIRSTEVEELLGLLNEPFAGAMRNWQELSQTDLQVAAIVDAAGQSKPYQQAAQIMSPDREVRRQTYENSAAARRAYQNTLASNYITSVQQNTVLAKARRYESVLHMRLAPVGLPTTVYHNLMAVFAENLGVWHRYWEVKRRMLGLDQIHPYDILAPIVENPPDIPFEQAVEWICAALQPLGEEYVTILRKGCLEERWIDYSNSLNKPRLLAFACQSFDRSPPYITIPYNRSLLLMSVLSHELGHAMNYYLVGEKQPPIYNQSASESVIETASNFHQALTRAYLRQVKAADESFMIALIDEALANFYRYFFYMPNIARFEYEVHQRVRHGEPLNAGILNKIMGDYLAEGYGSTMTFDRDQAGATWSELIHVFIPFYSFQYAVGISAAHALADDVLAGKDGAVQKYLDFASLGTAKDALDAFDVAGVDMRTREPIERAFAVLNGLVDQLEALAS